MTRINTNVSSLTAQKTLSRSNLQLQEALTRLSTGLRINVGKDDPAGLIASEVLRSDIISVQKAITNSQRANQLIATADSALGQVSSLLNDIRGLVSESANTGALSAEQLAANQLQVDSSLEAIDRIAQTTQFQGRRLLDGSLSFLTTAAGTNTAARGTFGTAVDSSATGQIGSAVDARSTGAIGDVLVDAVATGSIGSNEVDARATGSFGTTVDAKAATTVGSGGGGAVLFTAQESGYAGNDIAINFTSGGGSSVAVNYDGANGTLEFVVSTTTTAADIVSALQASPSAYLALSASVASAGTVSAGSSGTTSGGSSNNNILLSATSFGAEFNDLTIEIVSGAALGSETAAYDTGTNTLTVTVNDESTTAAVISAINSNGVFKASTTGAGRGRYTPADSANQVTTGGSANNRIILESSAFGPQYNNATVTIGFGAGLGSETAVYDTGANVLALTINNDSTTAAVISAINANGAFKASTTGEGLGRYSAGTLTDVTTGGSANNKIILSAANVGAQFNDATITIATGAALGSETAAYDTGTNTLTVTVNDASSTAAVISAINSNGVFKASTTGAGRGRYTPADSANQVTTGGSANNRIILESSAFGPQYNNATVTIGFGAGLGSETAVYDTGANVLALTINSESTTAAVISAINANGVFRASTDGAGLGRLSAGSKFNVTSGGSSDNRINLSAKQAGSQFNNTTVTIVTGAVLGSETAAYNTATNTLTLTIHDNSTAAAVAAAINNNGVFEASLADGASGLGKFTAGTTLGVTAGGSSDNRIVLSATSTGSQFNNASIVVNNSATLGSETAVYDADSNTLTLNINANSTALAVIQAINAEGTFSASLASGSSGQGVFAAGTTANVTRGAGVGSVTDLKVDQANFGTASSIGVSVQIDRQATKANLVYSGGTLTSAVTLEIGGANGFEVFNFGAGSTVSQIAEAVNLNSDATGVEAKVENGELVLNSIRHGSSQFVSVKTLSGTFTTTSDGVATQRATGTDVDLRINGIRASGDGLRASLNTSALDISFTVKEDLTDGSSFDFAITGGGAVFQLGPDIVSNQQARLSIDGISTSTLGGPSGRLFELRSGGAKSLTADAKGAAAIVEEVIQSITGLRGRLGAFQRTTLDTNIFTLSDTLENLTDAESSIRDADFAAESAKLTRAQILVQSGTQVLGIANQNPQNVLALLR